jgi:hypothetical protein
MIALYFNDKSETINILETNSTNTSNVALHASTEDIGNERCENTDSESQFM